MIFTCILNDEQLASFSSVSIFNRRAENEEHDTDKPTRVFDDGNRMRGNVACRSSGGGSRKC